MHLNNSANKSLRRFSQSFLGKFFIYLCLFSLNISYIPLSQASSELNEPITYDSSSTLGMSSEDLGLSGPFSFGAGYGTLGQYNLNAQYTEELTEHLAISGLIEYGEEMYRLGATLGFAVLDQGLAKISAERLSQLLPFSFDSGDIEEDVAQNAYGARYQHAFNHFFMQNISMGAYYANAPNVALDPVIFEVGDLEAINYRNIAGAASTGVDVASDFRLTPFTELSAQIFYDDVTYDMELSEDTSHDAQGLGGGLGVKQLLTDRLAVSAVGSVRELYDVYTLGISWLPKELHAAEVALLGQRIASHNETPDNNMVGIQLSYNFGMRGAGPRYELSKVNPTTDVVEWTNTPAVYMEQVLAVSDEYSEFLAPLQEAPAQMLLMDAIPHITKVSPISGPISGGTTVIITGNNFTNASAVQFGASAATSFNVDSATQITAVSPAGSGTVDIRVTTPLGTSPIVAADHFTYQDVPTVTSISPNAGVPSGNTLVTITGNNFLGASAVNFGSTPGTSLTVVNANKITVRSPIGSGTVDITVVTPSGTSATSDATLYTYEAKPTVTGLSPKAGPLEGGTTVILTGTNFVNATSVKFGAVVAQFTVNSATQITAISPTTNTAGPVYVTVTTPVGTSPNAAANQFTYENAPMVTSLSPSVGALAGNTTVVIKGSGFIDTTSVQFGAIPAKSFTVNSATQITAISPAASAGTVNVIVTTPLGSSSAAPGNQFTYEGPPAVSAISPKSGPLNGGTSVVITGVNFTGTTAVKFGKTAATSFTINSPTQITAIAPSHAAGTVDIRITTPLGTSPVVAVDKFTYKNAPAPVINTLSPISGSLAGGTSVVITGTDFTDATAVKFGANNATSFTVNSATQITAMTPASSAGDVDVTVTTPFGNSGAKIFTYQDVPTVSAISPKAGLPSGNTPVTITGTNFIGATNVKFGSSLGTNMTVVSATQITVNSPAGTGEVDIIVTTPSGESASSDATKFMYEEPPTVTGATPNAGPLEGLATVIINGTNFIDATAVQFGNTDSVSFNVDSATQITAISPQGIEGGVNITVTTPVGSGTSSESLYYYQAPPTITTIAPPAGLPAGGTRVVITGNDFLGTSEVKFGEVATTQFTIDSATQITAISPQQAAGDIMIKVTTLSGTNTTSPIYTYEELPSVTQLSPNKGPLQGGNEVIITGENFIDTTSVKFGETDAQDFIVNSATQITAIAPLHNEGFVHVTVTTPVGTSVSNANNQYIYNTLDSITMTPENSSLGVGTAQQFIVMGSYTDGTYKNISDVVIWSSADPNIATVTPTGLVRGIKAGTTIIAAQDPITGIIGSTNVTIVSIPHSSSDLDSTKAMNTPIQAMRAIATPKIYAPLSITLNMKADTLAVGDYMQVYAIGDYDGLTKDITSDVTWSIENPKLATIDAEGMITAHAPGETIVIASYAGVTNTINISLN